MEVPSDKPFTALERFATMLGWLPLEFYQHRDEHAASGASVVTWYESGDRTDCFLQFNEYPIGQTASYVGAVYAIRYRICTGWHPFALRETDEDLSAEAHRLENWLGRQWFDSLSMRRKFRQLHPECAGYSWQRIRAEGPPYSV